MSLLKVIADRGATTAWSPCKQQPALMALAEAGLLARDSDVALDAWARAAAVDPGDPEPLLNRAKLLGQLARYAEAKAAFEAVLAVRPGHPEAVVGLRRVEVLVERDG